MSNTATTAAASAAARLAETYDPPKSLTAYALPLARACVAQGEPLALMLAGPAGTGKTEAAYWLASELGYPIHVVDCSLVREPRDFMGTRDILADGTTGWNDSQFTRAIEGGKCLLLLDEVNRAAPAVLNALLPLLDRRSRATIQERSAPVIAGPGIVWVATRNEGAEFTGTQRSDRALLDRFPRTLRMEYLTPAKEAALLRERTGCSAEQASTIARFTAATRQADGAGWPLSPRAAIALAQDLAAGLPARNSLAAMLDAIPDEDTRAATARLAVAAGVGKE